jgi:hypothetical protein
MIARVFEPGSSFGRTCQYVAEDLDRALVIYQEGVRGHSHALAARDFEMIAALHPTIGKPVFHAALTFHRDEVADEVRMIELANKYLDGVGMVVTQRLVVAHRDARHRHLHLVANRIDLEGDPIHNFPEVLLSRDTVRELVGEYGLIPVAAKDLRQTNFDALDASDTRRYVIYRGIRDCLLQVKDVDELEMRLKAQGIDTRYRLDLSGERIGVSFQYQNEAFRGSEIDRRCSLPALTRAIEQRLELSQWECEKRSVGQKIRSAEAVQERQELERKEALNQQRLLKEQELKNKQILAAESRQQEEMELKQRAPELREKQEQELRLRQGLRLRMH